MKERLLHYDLIRAFACAMVVLMHSQKPEVGLSSSLLVGSSYLTAPCIGLFFMVSGALILGKNYSLEEFSCLDFFKKRLGRLLLPTMLWICVSSALTVVGIHNDEASILWFMYTLLGLYVLSPILIRWLHNVQRKEIEFYLCIWMFSLCVPFFKLVASINEGDTSWIYYFHGYVGYYVLGYYLRRYGLFVKETPALVYWIFWICFLVISVFLPAFFRVTGIEADFYSLFWYLSITVVLQCLAWWMVFSRVAAWIENNGSSVTKKIISCLQSISKLSFGIYLVHILILRSLLWQMDWFCQLRGVSVMIVGFALAFALSYIFCWLVSKWKFGKYIIG